MREGDQRKPGFSRFPGDRPWSFSMQTSIRRYRRPSFGEALRSEAQTGRKLPLITTANGQAYCGIRGKPDLDKPLLSPRGDGTALLPFRLDRESLAFLDNRPVGPGDVAVIVCSPDDNLDVSVVSTKWWTMVRSGVGLLGMAWGGIGCHGPSSMRPAAFESFGAS